ncbi:MAG: methyltransferase domain-containing protein [Candidatus Liptonbacteria bacterium]|nr:methyltransferase domain-containing protein [Candidatus Liptonbacteria bacterium]
MKNELKLKLHLGCGEKYLSGYVNIDYPQSEHSVIKVKADIYSDMLDLHYSENSVAEIRSHHLFEHFSRAEALALLMKWRRWLKPGGKLVIETPDFYGCAVAYAFALTQKRRMELGRHMLGSQEAKWAIHYDFWDASKFRYVFKKCGFGQVSIKNYQNAVAQHLPKIPLLNIVGNLLPASFYKRRGGHKLPNVVAVAYKSGVAIDENAVAREILSQYLVGKEGDAMLSVWIKQFEKAIKQ